jgi:hypothetical protein
VDLSEIHNFSFVALGRIQVDYVREARVRQDTQEARQIGKLDQSLSPSGARNLRGTRSLEGVLNITEIHEFLF